MVAPGSLAALIISTTMPDGPAALSDFIFEMVSKELTLKAPIVTAADNNF